MKHKINRLLSIVMVLALLLALAPAAFADGEGWDDDSDEYWISVRIPISELPMKQNDRTTVTAEVRNAAAGASYVWYCSDTSVVSVQGQKESATLTALRPGTAYISLTVTNADGLSEGPDLFNVTVGNSVEPAALSGGASSC